MSGCYCILECYISCFLESSCLSGFICWNSQCLVDSFYIILLIVIGVELLLCLAIALTWNAITCFLQSNLVYDRPVLFVRILNVYWILLILFFSF